MNAITSIQLTRATGLISECGLSVRVASWAHASQMLALWARTASEGGGYDKIDFQVGFSSGDTYEGRVDLARAHVGGYDLENHVIHFLEYLVSSNHASAPSARTFLESLRP